MLTGPRMQGGFKSADGEEDDGTRTQERFRNADGGRSRGTERIQGCCQEKRQGCRKDLRVLIRTQGQRHRKLNEVLTEDRDGDTEGKNKIKDTGRV